MRDKPKERLLRRPVVGWIALVLSCISCCSWSLGWLIACRFGRRVL